MPFKGFVVIVGGSFVPLGTHARSSLRAVGAPFGASWPWKH
jgi:hypothetical protein